MIARPKTWACLISLASLVVGAASIILADFGAPTWVFILFGVWLWTVGLPTTLGVLLLTYLSGTVPWMTTGSFGLFVICASLSGLVVQLLVFLLAARLLRSRARSRS